MKRIKIVIVFCAVFSLLFSTPLSAETTLKLIAPWSGDELKGFTPLLREFEKRNPDIKVQYQSARPEDVATILANQFAVGKTSADLIDTAWGWYIKKQAEKGHILEVSDTASPADYVRGAMSEVSIGNKIYGVPSVGGITVPEYRISFFKKHNLPDPSKLKSWAEFISLLDSIKAIDGVDAPLVSGGGVGWTFSSVVETWILSQGGEQMHKDLTKGRIAWTDPAVRNLFRDKLLPLIKDGYFGEPDEYSVLLDSMWSGITPIMIGDSTDTQTVKPPEDRGVFLLPGQKAVMFWYDYWFIPKYTKHPEEAKKLLKFLTTEGQSMQVKNGGRIGTYKGIDENDYPLPERTVLQLVKSVGVVPDMDDTIGGEFQSVFWNYLALLWSDPSEKTLDNVLNEFQRASEATLKVTK